VREKPTPTGLKSLKTLLLSFLRVLWWG
jgi:hypothetical protein